MNKELEHTSFPALADRVGALYNEEEDALLLGMLGQEYVIRRGGITLRGQKAPDLHEQVILEYLSSRGVACVETPWRSLGDISGQPVPEFRKRVELPIAQHAAQLIPRADALLPLFDGIAVPSVIGSDMAIMVVALPRVRLRVELSQEDQDFPPEAWVLFSNNADSFLNVSALQSLGELFKERLLSLLRIY